MEDALIFLQRSIKTFAYFLNGDLAMHTPALSSPGPHDVVVVPRSTPVATRRDLLGLSREEMQQAFIDVGLEPKQARLRMRQVWHWVYHRGVRSFSAMHNIAKAMQVLLEKHFSISRPEISSAQISEDGTRKWLLRLADGNEIETVFIPDADRGTLCVSAQIGCTLNCRFCHTGTMKLVRNLSAGEIVAQILLARDELGEWPSTEQPNALEGRLLTNVVLMGMGEPLYNFDNVKQALAIVMDEEGIQLSRRRITLSTSGVVPMMARAGEEIGVNLAVSLHAVRKEVRDEIVPLNKKYGIEQLLEACAAYPGVNNARRITFEYTLLKGKNDSEEDARTLVALLKRYKIPAKVNLIPFNPWPGSAYECSDWETIHRFSEIIFNAGISAPIRTPRGRDIMAACGQLKSASEKISKAEVQRRQDAKEAEILTSSPS
jgi:23S rRNA (adenine2503-C2)-methyltransferase